MSPSKLPLPLFQAFLPCLEIFEDIRSSTFVLIAPINTVARELFPTLLRMSVYMRFTGAHGAYQFRLELRDGMDNVAWEWQLPDPYECHDPLAPNEIALYDITMKIPKPGTYRLVLCIGAEDVAHQSIQIIQVQ